MSTEFLSAGKSVVARVRSGGLTRRFLDRILVARAERMVAIYRPHLPTGPIVDVGAGTGHTTAILRSMGWTVMALDVIDLSLVSSVRPIIADGARMPFRDYSFGAAILQTVLHHTTDPQLLLAEARRTAQTVIVVEDVIGGPFSRRVTHAVDSLLNLEFRGHPHTNKSESEWIEIFKSLHLRIASHSAHRKYGLLRQVTFVLKGPQLTDRTADASAKVSSFPTTKPLRAGG